MTELREEELIYDWNGRPQVPPPPRLIDHTLACARLSPRIACPTSELQRDLLQHLKSLHLNDVMLGSWTDSEVRQLAPACPPLELQAWVESPAGRSPDSPVGAYLPHRLGKLQARLARHTGPRVVVVQDPLRKTPDELVSLLRTLAPLGISGLCLSDDRGRATPEGTRQLVEFLQEARRRLGVDFQLEWSGRNDRGLALANALAAWRAGASVLHGAFFSLGEGCGLVATEQLLVNLQLAGSWSRDLSHLGSVTSQLAEALGLEIYPNAPILGADAFRTGTGVHAAAIMKAHRKGHDWLADLIYSGVPAARFGFHQIIEVGPMAGASNVQHWLSRQGLPADPDLVQALLQRAKSSARVLRDEELWEVVQQCGASA